MTLATKIGLAINVCVGGVIASIIYRVAGCLVGILGFFLGFFISHLCLLIIVSIAGVIWRIWNPLPVCKNGKCKGRDYQLWGNTTTSAYWRCKCGDQYCQRRRAFMYVNDKGEVEPYMVYESVFGHWHLEK